MVVTGEPGIAGRSVAEGGLRNLQGVYLVEVERDGHRISSVRPDEILAEGDRLTFAGNVGRILDLQGMRGLASVRGAPLRGGRLVDRPPALRGRHRARARRSPAARSRRPASGAATAARSSRSTARASAIAEKLGEVPLRAGDVLLVLAGPAFRPRALDRRDFLVVAPLDGDGPPREEKAPLVGPHRRRPAGRGRHGRARHPARRLPRGLRRRGARHPHAAEARDAVDLEVIVVIAASFGIGAAIESSGLAADLADVLIEPFGAGRPRAAVRGPARDDGADRAHHQQRRGRPDLPGGAGDRDSAGLDPRPFAIAIAIGASSSFLTPIGYQTNTMVYGIGGYRFGDYARLGLPLSIVMIAICMLDHPARVAPELSGPEPEAGGRRPVCSPGFAAAPGRPLDRSAIEGAPQWHTASHSSPATAPGRRSPRPPSASSTRPVLTSTGTSRRPASTSWRRPGTPLPDAVIESIKQNKVAIKGPITTPVGHGFR